MKTENQIYDEFCERENFNEPIKSEMEKDIKNSQGYTWYIHCIRMQEFLNLIKNEMKRILPKWLHRFI